MTRDEILDALGALLPSQFEAIVFRLKIPHGILSGAPSPQLTRAIEVIKHLENQGQLAAVVPHLRPATPAPPAPAAAPAATQPVTAPPAGAAPPSLADPALDEIGKAYDSKDLLLFVGAGLSTAAGLPSWKGLVDILVARVRARHASQRALDEIALFIQRNQYIDALSAAEQALGPTDFAAAVEQALDDGPLQVPDLGFAIAALAPKLRAVLTTNLDNLLEQAFAGRWHATPRATGDIARRRGYILKLHGTRLERATWVLTRAQYDRAMYADPLLQGAFTTLFHACPILFVGYGLSDDDLDALLGRVRALAGTSPPRHFALVDAATVTPFRQSRLEAGGIRLIPYDNPDGKHGAVAAVLRDLAARP
jgi:hypothetical protein